MQDEQKENTYVVKTFCDSISILIPLSSVFTILADTDVEVQNSDDRKITYDGREYPAYSLAELLNRAQKQNEKYVILIQDQDIEAALYVEHVDEVLLCRRKYKLPAYLSKERLDYILDCQLYDDGSISYQIDFLKLLKRYYHTQEENSHGE